MGRRAFTLIEVLVVVAIIAFLVSILLPSLQRARNMAKASVCLNNLKQIGSSMNFYEQESKGFLPPYRVLRPVNNNPNDPINTPYWFQYLPFKYMSNSLDATRCPLDDLKDIGGSGLRGPYPELLRPSGRPGAVRVYYSYSMNANMPMSKKLVYPVSMLPAADAWIERFNPGKLDLVRQPFDFAFLMETASTGLLNPGTPLSFFRYPHGALPVNMNIVFADSHAAPRDIKRIWPGDHRSQPPKWQSIGPGQNWEGVGRFRALWYGDSRATGPKSY